MIASFVIGFVAGVLALAAFALHVADGKQPEAVDTRIAATSVSMNGNSENPQSLYGATRIFREQRKGSA
jgi:hypothetical protein